MKKFLSIFLVFVLVLSLAPAAFAADKVAGDVNSDGLVSVKDITVLRRYIAGGYGVTIDKKVSDVNLDDAFNAKDLTLIRRYVAGGYNVELLLPKVELKDNETTRVPLN